MLANKRVFSAWPASWVSITCSFGRLDQQLPAAPAGGIGCLRWHRDAVSREPINKFSCLSFSSQHIQWNRYLLAAHLWSWLYKDCTAIWYLTWQSRTGFTRANRGTWLETCGWKLLEIKRTRAALSPTSYLWKLELPLPGSSPQTDRFVPRDSAAWRGAHDLS